MKEQAYSILMHHHICIQNSLSTYYKIIFVIAILNFSRLFHTRMFSKAGKNLQKGENLLSSLNLKFYISFTHF